MNRSSFRDTWHVIPAMILESRTHFDLLAEDPFALPAAYAALFREWDGNGYGLLSILDLDSDPAPYELRVYEPKRHLRTPRFSAASRRRRTES